MTQWLPGTTRNRIQDLCRDRNITQSELAQQVEIDKSTLSRFLNEKTNSLSEACIIRIAEYFKVSTDFLLGVTDIPDRKHYEIEELGLTIEAAKKLYLRKVDPAIVSQLIAHPKFNELTQQLALYQEGTLAAGLAAQEQMIQSMTEMLIQQATNYPEDKPAAAKTIQALHGLQPSTPYRGKTSYSAEFPEDCPRYGTGWNEGAGSEAAYQSNDAATYSFLGKR